MIADKLVDGSPRTVKIFERFVLQVHNEESSKPKLKEKRNLYEAYRKHVNDYGFLKRMIEDGQAAHVKQSVLDILYLNDEYVPLSGEFKDPPRALPHDVTKSFD